MMQGETLTMVVCIAVSLNGKKEGWTSGAEDFHFSSIFRDTTSTSFLTISPQYLLAFMARKGFVISNLSHSYQSTDICLHAMTIHRYEVITKATLINFTSIFWSLHHLFDWILKNSSCSIETALHCWRPPSVYSYTKLLSTYQCTRSWEGYKCKDTIHGPHHPEALHLWPLIVKSQYYRNIKSQKKL